MHKRKVTIRPELLPRRMKGICFDYEGEEMFPIEFRDGRLIAKRKGGFKKKPVLKGFRIMALF